MASLIFPFGVGIVVFVVSVAICTWGVPKIAAYIRGIEFQESIRNDGYYQVVFGLLLLIAFLLNKAGLFGVNFGFFKEANSIALGLPLAIFGLFFFISGILMVRIGKFIRRISENQDADLTEARLRIALQLHQWTIYVGIIFLVVMAIFYFNPKSLVGYIILLGVLMRFLYTDAKTQSYLQQGKDKTKELEDE